MIPLPRTPRMITWDKVFVSSLIRGASLTQNRLSVPPSPPPPCSPSRLLDPPLHPAAGACACLRAGRLQGGGCASQACPRTRRMRRTRRGDRTVCVEVDGELSRGDAVTPSNPPPATFGGEWWGPGGCVRACARDQHASATLPEDSSAQRHAHVYIQTARVRALTIQRASCRRLVTADAKTK